MRIMCVLWKQVPACPVNDIADFMERFSPAVEVEGPEAQGQLEAFLDVTGCRLPPNLAPLIEGRTGAPPYLALGQNKFVAHTAALLARSCLLTEVPDGREKDFLSPLSIDLLPLTLETRSRLHYLGLTTMGQLASLPRSALAMQFGPEGARAWDLANGIDTRSVIPRRPLPQLSRQITFDAPVVHRQELTAALETTVEEMVTTLIQQQLVCGALSIDLHLHTSDLYLQDPSTHRQDPRYRVWARPPHPTSSLSELAGLLRRQLPTTISSPVTSATLTLSELKSGGEQMSLFAGSLLAGSLRDAHPHKRDEAVAAIQRRWGKDAILRVISREPRSLLPEKRWALILAGEPPPGDEASVIPLLEPKEVNVEVDAHGKPAQIISRGRRRAVGQVQNQWRIDDEWWRGEISRMYYQVVLADNSFHTVFQDLQTGRWYEQSHLPDP